MIIIYIDINQFFYFLIILFLLIKNEVSHILNKYHILISKKRIKAPIKIQQNNILMKK
jgi:hypothetical protein